MATGIVFEFDASQHAVLDLFVLGAILVLPLARMLATCHKCSSKLSMLAIEPKSLQQRQLRKNHNFGPLVASQESQLWDSHQLAGSKMVPSRDHVVKKR